MADTQMLIEQYARSMMNAIVHSYADADPVRRGVLRFARKQGYPHLDRAEAAALYHDIGPTQERREHAQIAADGAQ
jgi:hypothetical protein